MRVSLLCVDSYVPETIAFSRAGTIGIQKSEIGSQKNPLQTSDFRLLISG